MLNNRSLVFWPMKGNFPCFPLGPLVRVKEDLLSPFNVCRFSNLFVIHIFQHSAKVLDKFIKGSSKHSNVSPDQLVI